MQHTLRRLAIAFTFFVWVLPRVFPLLMHPGLYSFDSWYFMGYAESILVWNHIPPLNPFVYYYISHPALYLFTVQISYFLGIPLLESFRLFAVILIVNGFLVFYTLFRRFLGPGRPSIIAMLIFAVAVDVIAQTNSVIQENMALIFLGLILLSAFSLTLKKDAKHERVLISILLVIVIVLTHHLTTYFAIIFALALLVASILNQDEEIRKMGIIAGSGLAISLFSLLMFINPIMLRFLLRYALFVIPGLVSFSAICVLLFYKQNWVRSLSESLKSNWAKWMFPLLGFIVGAGFYIGVLLFYPYGRPTSWVALKFGLFAIFLGLSISAIRLLPWIRNQKQIIGFFVIIAIVIVGISFLYSGALTLVYTAIGVFAVEVSIGHRHFTFLLIPFAVSATVSLFYLKQKHQTHTQRLNRMIFPTIALLILFFAAGNIYNLYNPAGGWYPEWCSHSEIATGYWLRTPSTHQSTIATDHRLTRMMYGMTPIDSNWFNLVWLDPAILPDPKLILNNLSMYQDNVYFFTSELSEANFIIEFLQPPISLDCSTYLDQASSVARIYSREAAQVYRLLD